MVASEFGVGVGTGNTSATSKIGCESLNASVQQYSQSLSDISCIISQSTQTNTADNEIINSVSVTPKGFNPITGASSYVTFNCAQGGLQITQGANLNVTDITQLSDSQINDITTAVQNVVNSVAQNLQSDKSGFGSTEQGSKVASQIMTQINQTDYKQQVTDIVNKNLALNIVNNTLDISPGNGAFVVFNSASDCELGQNG